MPPATIVRYTYVLIAALLIGAQGCTKANPNGSAALADSPVDPSGQIRLLDLDGKPFDLWSQTHSPITVVVFTRTDCPISNRAAPEVCRLCELYQPRGVKFFLIYVDPKEQPETIRQHLQEYGYPCPGIRDPEHSLVTYCKATATPEAVVFNNNHEIVYQGRINDQYVDLGNSRTEPTTNDLANAIKSTVLGQPVATPRTRAIGCSIADLKP
jgi:hypothetical protein